MINYRNLYRLPVICTFVMVLLHPAPAIGWMGKVIDISRADEFRVQADDGQTELVRVYGIDTPQEPQPFGREARLYVKQKVLGKYIQVDPLLRDHFGRIIAYVYTDGESLAEDLLRQGLAWWYKKYVPWELGLAQLEREARESQRGLWAGRAPIPPWEYQDLPAGEGVGPKTDESVWRRGLVREKLIQEVGRSKQVLGDRGSVVGTIRRGPSHEDDLPRVRDVENVSRSLQKMLPQTNQHQSPQQ